MKISLIIPAYNEEEMIAQCLKCVLENAPGKFCEILVIDNASTDSTAKVASSFQGVTVVSELQKGATFARQKGFECAQGDIIAYIDSDSRMPKGWYEKIEQTFTLRPDAVSLSGPYEYYDLHGWHATCIKIWYTAIAMPMYAFVGYMLTAGNFAIKKDILQKMGGLDTKIIFYGDDTNIARRASSYGKVVFSRDFVMPTSARRLHGQGLINTAWIYGINFLSEVFLKKPVTKSYEDFR